MRSQILDGLRAPAPLDIGGRRNQDPAKVRQLAADQFGVPQSAHPEREVIALPNDIDVSVCDVQLKFHTRMACQKLRSPSRDIHPSELLRCGDSKQSLGLRSHLDNVFCLLNAPKQRCHALVIGLTLSSKVERTRRTLNEPHTEATLQARDTFRDCGLA